MKLSPLKFEAWLRPMIWGGEKIAPFKGVCSDADNIGESWEISAVEGHVSKVSEGPLKGRTLTDLIKEYKGSLVGEKVYERNGDLFPLLIKFIDAKSDLSVQVHPDDDMAMRVHGQKHGKTEMWYVVGGDKDASLLCGFKKQINKDEYVKAVGEDKLMDVLARYEIKPGDVFFLPAGRVHAIGAGAFVAEIQQTSDLTYRIYDYNRKGADGKPRELHTELAKEAVNFDVLPDYRTKYDYRKDAVVPLVDCQYFTTDLLDLDKPLERDFSKTDSFVVVMGLDGEGTIATEAGDVTIRRGETVLLPASINKATFTPKGKGLKILNSYIG